MTTIIQDAAKKYYGRSTNNNVVKLLIRKWVNKETIPYPTDRKRTAFETIELIILQSVDPVY